MGARRARWPTLLVGIVVLGGAVAMVVNRTGEDATPVDADDSGGESVLVADHAAPLSFGRPPTAFRVTYRVESHSGGETTVTAEEQTVRRPWDARRVVSGGVDGSGFVQASTFARFANLPREGEPAVFVVPPVLAAFDLRPDVVLPAAVDRDLVEVAERRLVAGRECTVYRAGDRLSVGTLVPFQAGAPEWAEGCFDEDGMLLEERWYRDGRLARHKVAVEVEVGASVLEDRFALPDATASFEEGNGSVRAVTADSRPPGRFVALRGAVPSGFSHDGRYAVVWPAQLDRGPDTGLPAAPDRVGTVVDVWTRGPDVLVLERGGSLHGRDRLPEPANEESVALAGLGEGELVLDLRSVEVQVRLDDGQFVRLFGTLAPYELVALAQHLEEVPGGELTYVD